MSVHSRIGRGKVGSRLGLWVGVTRVGIGMWRECQWIGWVRDRKKG